MNINQSVLEVIKILMEESFWGKNSSNASLIEDLNNEVEEFIQGTKNKDVKNTIEEAADVMMIMFCIMYKIKAINDENSIEEIMKAIVKKLKRRYRYLYDGDEKLEKEEEEKTWKNAKEVENKINYMFCDNSLCDYFGEIGEGNIKMLNGIFYCEGCNRQIKVSKKTMLFYNKKNRKKHIQKIVDSILEYIKGNNMAPQILKTDSLETYIYFYNDILMSEYNLREFFVKYVSKKYKVTALDVSRYCDDIVTNYGTEKSSLLEYCREINGGNYKILNDLTNEEIRKVRNKLSSMTIDVEKRIEKVVKYEARNWNNQLVHKYLLNYGKDQIIECMTIIHYKDEAVRDLTIELSNMYNCIVGCRFCASGALPQAATFLEATDYVRQLNTCLKESGINPNEFEKFYVSFAGIGEPSVVYKTIAEGMVMIRDLYPQVMFNIATFGFNVVCFEYWRDLDLPIRTLQVPFYSHKLEVLKYVVKNLPETYSFETILSKAVEYKNKHSECRVKVNYIVMKGINDEDDDIKNMCVCLEPFKEQIVVRISYLNYTKPGAENNILSVGSSRLTEIKRYLDGEGFESYIFGTSINTELGCGQLAQNHISCKDV